MSEYEVLVQKHFRGGAGGGPELTVFLSNLYTQGWKVIAMSESTGWYTFVLERPRMPA